MAALRDLATVLVQPQQTMRRVLEGGDRWTIQVVILAFVCSSVGDANPRVLAETLPGLGWSALAVVALSLVVGSLTWVIALWLLGWIAGFVARKIGGTAKMSDVRAAMAWGLVPVIWSLVYRIPLAIFVSRFHANPNINVARTLIDFASTGALSIVIVFLALQLLFAAWSVWVGSFCLAEAEQFSPLTGLGVIAITFSIPFVIAAAAVVNSLSHGG
ncbi:MAG TPA: YIP1 family protein [Thermoanaerobaculia bacterium]|jgi:hypothetical protein|nr:YIP1 family protein [Thermoanaerobaculia bacterium]